MFKTTQQGHIEARDLAAAVQTFPDAVQQGLESFFAGHLSGGERLPDFGFAQELIRRVLAAASASLQATDGSLTVELVSHAALRDRREQSRAELRDLLGQVRFFFDQMLEPGVVLQILPVRRFSNMKPALLAAVARRAAAALRDPALRWEDRPYDLVFGSPATTADRLDAVAARLQEILDRLAGQKRSAQNELGAKTASIESAADVTRRCKKFLDGLYRLAGLDFHADRLARPRRRKRRPAAPADR